MVGRASPNLSGDPVRRLTVCRASFVFAVQTWLAQTPEQARNAGTPGYLAAGMARKFARPVHWGILMVGSLQCWESER